MKCLALLWAEMYELFWGRKSSSRLAAKVGDGARYWMGLLGALGVIEEKISPCGSRGFDGAGLVCAPDDHLQGTPHQHPSRAIIILQGPNNQQALGSMQPVHCNPNFGVCRVPERLCSLRYL